MNNLLLAEKLMLLALDDDKGNIVMSSSTALSYGLAGAALFDLLFLKKIHHEEKRIKLVDSSSTGNALLDEVLSDIRASRKDRSIKYWIRKLGNSRKKLLKETLLDGLVEKRILKKEGKKILWVFEVDRYPTFDPRSEQELRHKIRNIVLFQHPPSEEETALLGLIKACDLTKEIFKKEERKQARKNLNELTRDEKIGETVSAIVTEMTIAVMVAVTAATTAATTSTR